MDEQSNVVELSNTETIKDVEPVEQVLEPLQNIEPVEQVLEPLQNIEPVEQVLEPLENAEPVKDVEPVEQVVLEPLLEIVEQVVLEPLLETVQQLVIEPLENVVSLEKLELTVPIEPLLDPVQVIPVENVVTNLHIEESVLKPIENPILDEISLETNSDLVTIDIHDPSKSENTLESINKIANDQDTMQRINVSIQVLLEMYRVITSSLLILFVPQICDDHICTTTENLVWETSTYNTALCFNFISMAFLVNMYYLELVRENRLIKYLSINPELANDNEEVGNQLQLLPVNKQNKIFSINKYYRLSAYVALGIYVLNVMLSAAAVNKYYAGSQTTSTFVTYVLFIATKFASVKTIISTDKNIFYSAYILSKVQFNDVDPDCINTKS